MSVSLKTFAIICSVFLVSCTSRRTASLYSGDYIPVPICGIEKDAVDRLIADYEAIPLETNDSCLISSIHQLFVTERYLYILDGKMDKVYLFDREGKYVSSIRNQGGGPAEYVSIGSLEVDTRSGRLLLSDSFSRRIFIYDETGSLLKTIQLDFVPFQIVPVGNGCFYNLYPGSNRCYEEDSLESHHIHLIDSLGRIVRTLLPDRTPERIDLRCNFTTNYTKDGNLMYIPDLSDTVYEVSPDSVTPLYVMSNSSGFRFPTVSDRRQIGYVYGVRNDYERFEKSGYLLSWGGFLDTDHYLFFLFGWDNPYYLLYAKADGSSVMVSREEIHHSRNLPVRMLLGRTPYTAVDDWFYTSVHPMALEETAAEADSTWMHTFEGIDRDANPVIVRYKLAM